MFYTNDDDCSRSYRQHPVLALVFNSLYAPPRGEKVAEVADPVRMQDAAPGAYWAEVPRGPPPIQYPAYPFPGYWVGYPGGITPYTPFTPQRGSQPLAWPADPPVGVQGNQPYPFMPWMQPGPQMFPATPPNGYDQMQYGRSSALGNNVQEAPIPTGLVQSATGLIIPIYSEVVFNRYLAENPHVIDTRRFFPNPMAQAQAGMIMPHTPQSILPNRGVFDSNGGGQGNLFLHHERADTNQSFTSTNSFSTAASDGSPSRMPCGPPPAYGVHPLMGHAHGYPVAPPHFIPQRLGPQGGLPEYQPFHEAGL
ncbi:hypothetical protein DACRYDRAFT_23515 [Dacryopinax primogenitus]|uniref:Uncharacterized protein n=1 Tax=Dacryopinax primogenitus (strain DJM 731) TaxID=1858805 RepID=M5FWB5_DACPD|nr:uncharacterized protein DACRYDRAFT_23515 [Dacryopinax primogenitus]EJT99979.1 hypothetical protein DACRYDRAFT_23515 [Dacryopinax primogenitus]